MERSSDVLRLENEVAAAIAECTAALNEQFLALVAGDGNLARFDERIERSQKKRQQAMAAFLNHIREHGWE